MNLNSSTALDRLVNSAGIGMLRQFSMTPTAFGVAVFVLLLLPLRNLVAQEVKGTPVAVATRDAEQQEIGRLIRALGSPKFASREEATQALAAIGEPALPQLKEVGRSEPFELRHRAALLQQRIEQAKFARLSKSFLLDLDDQNSYGLPGWDTYRELVGASRTSKLLFLEMLRCQPEVAQLIQQADDDKMPEAARLKLADEAAQRALAIRADMYRLVEPRIGDSVAMLVAACALPTQTPVEISDVIAATERMSFGGNIFKQGYASCLKKLMSGWLPKTHASMGPTSMEIAVRNDLAEGAVIARRHLTPNFDNETRKWAFYCLTRFGTESDIPRLMKLLDDGAIVDEFARAGLDGRIHESNSAPPGTDSPQDYSNLVVRVNDLALVTILTLRGEDPTQIFPRFQPHPQLGFFIHSLATESPDERRQAIEAWRRKYAPTQSDS